MTVPEAPLADDGNGLAPTGDGWFVLNARDARWSEGHFGAYTPFEGDARFPQLGINVAVLQPGQPACMYHGEGDQEGFLVLAGECLLLVEGHERRLRPWDYFHCPPWTEHVLVGAGDGPCHVLGVGARTSRDVVYPANEVARSHDAGVPETTRDPEVAYEPFPRDTPSRARPDWLPDL